LDKIFAKGHLWQHRTLELFLTHFQASGMKQHLIRRLRYSKKSFNPGTKLGSLIIEDYKDVISNKIAGIFAGSVEDALISLLHSNLAKGRKENRKPRNRYIIYSFNKHFLETPIISYINISTNIFIWTGNLLPTSTNAWDSQHTYYTLSYARKTNSWMGAYY